MKHCIVTSVSTGGSGGEERLTENVSINFGHVKYEYMEQAEDGTGSAGPEFVWNIQANEPA